MPPLEIDICLAARRLILLVLDSGSVKHLACCHSSIQVVVLVIEINDLADTLLDQGLGAFIAREKSDINSGSCEVTSLGIEDSVELSVSNKSILGIECSAVPCPREFLVIAADGEAVVTDRQDVVIHIDDAGADLCARVLASHCSKLCNAHKILVPADIVSSLVAHKALRKMR